MTTSSVAICRRVVNDCVTRVTTHNTSTERMNTSSEHNYDYSSRPPSVAQTHAGHMTWSAADGQAHNTSQFYHHNSGGNASMMASMAWQQQQQSQQSTNVSNDYYTRYVSEYYRQYYERMVMQSRLAMTQHSQRSQATPRAPQTPLKHHCSHARASFSACGRLVVIDNGNTRVSFVPFSDIACVGRSWPLFDRSPLARLSADDARRVALQWLAWRSSEVGVAPELALVLRVVTTLLKQSGHVCGADLTEVLLTPEAMEEELAADDAMAIALRRFRRLLARGQREAAILHASDSGLHDHALTLSVLSSDTCALSTSTAHVIRRFITTLAPEDPLSVLYSSLLSSARVVSRACISLECFIILIANDVSVDATSVTTMDCHFPNLLRLIVSLSDHVSMNYDFVVNVCDDFCDHVILNECLEFARSMSLTSSSSELSCTRFSNDLLLQKLVFASMLFDYGARDTAIKYCDVIRACGLQLTPTAQHVLALMESRVKQTDISVNDADDGSDVIDSDLNAIQFNNNSDVINNEDLKSLQSEAVDARVIDANDDIESVTRHVTPPPMMPLVGNSNGPVMMTMPSQTQPLLPFDDSNQFSFVSTNQMQTQQRFERQFSENSDTNDVINNESIDDDFYDKMVLNTRVTQPQQQQSFDQNNKQNSDDTSESTTTTSATSGTNAPKSGIIESFWGKLKSKSRHVPTATRAKLPDDTNKSIVWDETRKQWIDTSAVPSSGDADINSVVNSGPPRVPLINSVGSVANSSGSGSGTRDRRFRSGIGSRYVDVFNQQNNSIKSK